MSTKWKESIIWIIKANLILLIVDSLLLPILSLFLNQYIPTLITSGYYSKILLLNSGIIFLAGGLVAMSSSIFPSKIREHVFHTEETWSPEKQKKGEAKANLYIIAGVLLFIESMFVAFTNL